jgi:hypothetical protein
VTNDLTDTARSWETQNSAAKLALLALHSGRDNSTPGFRG